MHGVDGSSNFLQRKERVTKGDYLTMISYGIGILLIIRDVRAAHPQVRLQWYIDDAGSGGKFDNLYDHMPGILVNGPPL